MQFHSPKLSEYSIAQVQKPQELKELLAKAYGIQAVVHKTRTLICAGRTRIHFDNVGDLGDFIELEVVLKDGDSLLDAEKEVLQIMQHLEITEDALVKEAYVDLLSNSYSEPPIKHRQASK